MLSGRSSAVGRLVSWDDEVLSERYSLINLDQSCPGKRNDVWI